MTYTFNNTDVDALKVTVHMSVSFFSSQKRGAEAIFQCASFFPNEFCKDFGFPVTVEMSDWQLIASQEQFLQCTSVLACSGDRWQVSFPLTVPAEWYKCVVLITLYINRNESLHLNSVGKRTEIITDKLISSFQSMQLSNKIISGLEFVPTKL